MNATASQPTAHSRADTYELPVLKDPQATLAAMRADLEQWDAHWARWAENAAMVGGAESAAAKEAHQIRLLLRGFLAPRLDALENSASANLGLHLNLMVPYDGKGGLRDFMLHFFQIAEEPSGNLVYEQRDKFERDVYVLYDLYRVKKTLEVVAILRAARAMEERRFPSMFSEERILAILAQMTEVLGLLFSQCLPARHREELLPRLNDAFLKSRSLLHRRENDVLYTHPHVLEKYDYRRFFFLVYFKDGLKARLGHEEREFRYNFLHFLVLKHEFLVHWLTGPLRGDPRKFQIYKKYSIQGRSMLERIAADPSQEEKILRGMASHGLNDMASQVNESLPEEMKIGTVPDSREFGFYQQLKENLEHAVEMVRAPIENLRQMAAADPVPAPEAEARPVAATPPGPRPAPGPPPAEPTWQVTLLKKAQVPNPFFMDTIAGFDGKLNALKARMGVQWQPFASYTAKALENTAEMATVRRRTPKHEWTLPYRLRHRGPDGTREYLLVLGAEVKARPRGMGYQAKESYNFTPYFVLATDSPEKGFGEPVGERVAAGKQLQEYAFAMPAVCAKVSELLDVVKSKAG